MKIPNEKDGLKKRRHAMPQIVDFDAFIKDLEDEGHAVVTLTIDPNELTPTQGNFNEDKVKGMIDTGSWASKPIVTSDDDYVLDGHHRWLAAANSGKQIKSRVVDMPIDELLDFVKDKPYVMTKSINEGMEKTLQRVQDYYNRVARGEGGEQYAKLLNKVNAVRQRITDDKHMAMQNRAQIEQLLGKVLDLLPLGT